MKKIIISIVLVFLCIISPRLSHAIGFQHPLNPGGWYKSQAFGVWNSSFGGYHAGEDYTVNDDSELPVYATAKGIVKHVQQHTDYGYVVVIEHSLGNGNYVCSVYGHLRQNGLIGLGPVSKGQKIGYLSSNYDENGGYTFTHLHFGIRSDVYSSVADSDGKWRYRGYTSSSNILDFWYSPTAFLSTHNMQEIPDTGQTKCYDNSQEITCPHAGEQFSGQDAQYTTNPRSYTKLGASGNDLPDSATSWAMVRDNVTGLIWEMKNNMDSRQDYSNPHDADNTYTWYDPNLAINRQGYPGDGTDTVDIITALNAENYGGFSDWRLPTVKELSFISDRGIYNPAINSNYFPNTQASIYWSSTPDDYYTGNAWYVNFYDGYTQHNPKYSNYYVRAVRGGKFANSFIDNHDGTVTDTSTGLMWQQETAPGSGSGSYPDRYNWQQALSYCENLILNNDGAWTSGVPNASGSRYSDWRLPNISELQSLVNNEGSALAINSDYFPDTAAAGYFSSTTLSLYRSYENCVAYAWYVSFFGGNPNYYGKSDSYFVRAVRSVQINPDTDNLYDKEEQGPDGNNLAYDGNCDGTPDWQQSNVASFHNYNRQSYVTLESPTGTTFSNVQAVDNPSPLDIPLDVLFQEGFFNFTINNVTGGLAVVTLHLPVGTSMNTYYKYGPTPDNPLFHWYEFMYDSQTTGTGALINNNIVTLYFMDGRRGDDDLTENGTIVDVGGPGAIDTDEDGYIGNDDNCPNKPNGPSLGTCMPGSDKAGATCNSDADCVIGCSTNGKCSLNQEDTDSDGKGDVCDNCPTVCNPQQLDANGNGIGDLCDPNPECGGCSGVQCEEAC